MTMKLGFPDWHEDIMDTLVKSHTSLDCHYFRYRAVTKFSLCQGN